MDELEAFERGEELRKRFVADMGPAAELALELLAAEIPEGYGGNTGELAQGRIVRWNDHDDTTDEDVFAAYARAIEKLRVEESAERPSQEAGE
jgi:hypothetical protein